jgi:DNA-binding MarR family transcriptional regulator
MDLKFYGIDKTKKRKFEELAYILAFVYHLLEKNMSGYLKKFGFSLGQFNVLIIVEYHGGKNGISQVEIGKRLIVSPGNITRLLDKLEKEGLIKRHPDKKDRRIKYIRSTNKAKALIDKVWPHYENKLKELVGKISEREQNEILPPITKWLEKLLDSKNK